MVRMSARMFIIAAALFTAFSVSHAAPLREQRLSLSIERGSLASVLEQLSRQTGLQIGTEASVANIRANNFGPFRRRATPDEALKALLAGTDLWYAWPDDETIRLFRISSQRTNWTSGGSTAKEASDSIRGLAGVYYETGQCGHLPVGPFSPSDPLTAEAFWVELIKAHCPVLRKRTSEITPGSIDRLTLVGQTEHNFSIPQMPRVLAISRISEQAGVTVAYISTDVEEEQTLIGPISGVMSLNAALEQAMRGSILRARWATGEIVSVEPAYRIAALADMSKCACNFGLPEWWPPRTAHVMVERSRLPPLQEYSQAPIAVLDRAMIEATGATTLPELLKYLPQQVFSRSRTYRANAAQYFEGRGFGAQYALVLIDGHRAYGSAGDPITNAFDLNVVPLAAVERIEIALDQPSVLLGTDATGGTVNIVLRRDFENGASTLSLGSARDGAETNMATLLADGRWGDTNVGFVLDHLSRGELLGTQRDRWRNQDYERFDGLDYTVPFGAVQSISGELPSIGAESAQITLGPNGPAFLRTDPDRPITASPLAHASIVPDEERLSLYGFANKETGNTKLNLGLLLGRQAASFRLFPVDVPGLTWGERHPQNPFRKDVMLETLLTGLPARRQEVESTLTRVTGDVSGSIGGWEYSAFAVRHEDRSQVWVANEVDLEVLATSLTTEHAAAALNVVSDRPGAGPLPPGLIAERKTQSYVTRATQYGLDVSGMPIALPAGHVKANLGIARREESVRFDRDIGPLARDITSIFSRLRIPIIGDTGAPFARSLDLTLGARRDFHSDARDVTTWQYGLSWQPLSAITVHAGYSQLFRPPSLYELHVPRRSLPAQVFDPQRDEPAIVTLVSGGNASLRPTEGDAIDVGFSIDLDSGWKASLNYWDTQMNDRISAVLIQDLVQAEASDTVEGRIIRADPTASDIAAGRIGRMLTLDTTRANFGAIEASGFDFSVEYQRQTWIGRITPRIVITHTTDFRYRDLPARSTPMLNRAGVASLYGTVPSTRAIASIGLEVGRWHAFAFARHHSGYRDHPIVAGAATQRRIPDQTLLDIKLTFDISHHLTLSLGAHNVLDDQPPFAEVAGWEGFDPSQGDLVGREAFLNIAASF
jgi:iron complex outermembrane recepter protein